MNRIDVDGRSLEGLSFEAEEGDQSQQPTVLSCGGIYVPKQSVPSELKGWRDIVDLPGPEMAIKIFGFYQSPRSRRSSRQSKGFLN
ncbi:MAG: hypothetical protein HY073_00430 [Deltaproteobacteria bacterium]|nr:hypothetical protein [Deltaproteobacteria bacterium]